MEVFESNRIFFIHKNSQFVTDKQKCAVCFESEEDITQDKEKTFSTFITILCGHSFDFECIIKWQEDICAICRYEQTPKEINFCEECNNFEKLWICFTCGYLGCGDDYPMIGHIYQHYRNTSHAYQKPMFQHPYNNRGNLFDQTIGDFLSDVFYDAQNRNLFSKEYNKEKDKKDGKNEISYVYEQFEQDFMNKLSQQMKELENHKLEQQEFMVKELKELKNAALDLDKEISDTEKINQLLNEDLEESQDFLKKLKTQQQEIIQTYKSLKVEKQQLIHKNEKFHNIQKNREYNLKQELMKVRDEINQLKEDISDCNKQFQLQNNLKKKNIKGSSFMLVKKTNQLIIKRKTNLPRQFISQIFLNC